jgi:hypothetical protein
VEDSPARSFMSEIADIFAGMARVFRDPDVQEAGNLFFGALQRVSDRELPGGRPLMLDRPGEVDA